MPGSATVSVLQRSPRDLAVRAVLAFGAALGLFAWLAPSLLEPLLRYYETVVYTLDDRYWIAFTLTHQTGHDKIGSDLVLLGRATVMRPMTVTAGDLVVNLQPGQTLKSSTAIGVLLQPAIMIAGLLLAWPLRTARALPERALLAVGLLGFWLGVGVPLTLRLYFQDIPIRAFAPNVIPFETLVGRFLLNGGGLVLGALLTAAGLALTAARIGSTRP